MKLFPITGLVFLALLLPLGAQDKPEGRRVGLSICCLGTGGADASIFIKQGAQSAPTEVKLYQNGFPPAEPALVEKGRIVIYKEDPEAESGWSPDWFLPAPPAGRTSQFILLLPPKDPDSKSPYQPFVLPSDQDFRYGSVLALNLTGVDAGLHVGDRKVGVAPGKTSIFPLKPEVDAFNQADVSVSPKGTDGWVEYHTTKWLWNERVRQLTVIWKPKGQTYPEITSISEVKPWLNPEE